MSNLPSQDEDEKLLEEFPDGDSLAVEDEPDGTASPIEPAAAIEDGGLIQDGAEVAEDPGAIEDGAIEDGEEVAEDLGAIEDGATEDGEDAGAIEDQAEAIPGAIDDGLTAAERHIQWRDNCTRTKEWGVDTPTEEEAQEHKLGQWNTQTLESPSRYDAYCNGKGKAESAIEKLDKMNGMTFEVSDRGSQN